MANPIYDWSDLKELYSDRKLTCDGIAKAKGCCEGTVRHHLKRLGIPRRRYSEATKVAYESGRLKGKVFFDASDLRKLYLEDKLSGEAIARLKHVNLSPIYRELRNLGIPRRSHDEMLTKLRGSKNANWRGGRHKTDEGYVLVYNPDHPYANNSGYVLEHRLVMERRLGRYLMPWEVVHHKNRIRDDNGDENLELFPSREQHLPSMRWQQELRRQGRRIEELEKRVTLLEAENLVLRQGVGVEGQNE